MRDVETEEGKPAFILAPTCCLLLSSSFFATAVTFFQIFRLSLAPSALASHTSVSASAALVSHETATTRHFHVRVQEKNIERDGRGCPRRSSRRGGRDAVPGAHEGEGQGDVRVEQPPLDAAPDTLQGRRGDGRRQRHLGAGEAALRRRRGCARRDGPVHVVRPDHRQVRAPRRAREAAANPFVSHPIPPPPPFPKFQNSFLHLRENLWNGCNLLLSPQPPSNHHSVGNRSQRPAPTRHPMHLPRESTRRDATRTHTHEAGGT